MPRKKAENAETSENAAESVENTPNAEANEEQQPGIVANIVDTVTAAVSTVAENVAAVASNVASAVTGGTGDAKTEKVRHRAQKIGVVSSDKMTKTVVVKVDRQIMHPKYRRYIRRTTKFMAHDETGAGIGDKVRIEETRPLSARKRWRVIEVIQKAAK